MRRIEYRPLDEVDPEKLVTLLNKKKVREHLIEHAPFTVDSVERWVRQKIEESSSDGCKVRAILVDDQPAGWCGIQLDEKGYEIAIVVDEIHWGLGRKIFRDVMGCARDLGHREIFIHLLYTRPEYRFLRKMAKNVYTSERLDHRFTTYELAVK
jgi:GNAT superfamily N-acetyltransferase